MSQYISNLKYAAVTVCCVVSFGGQSFVLDNTNFPNEPISPLPLAHHQDPAKISVGRALFNDVRLSKDNTVSCATCHRIELGGTDHLPKSMGVEGQIGNLNAPTVFNSGLNFLQFWDGRAESLEAQVDGPIHNSHEMATSWPELLSKLQADSALMESIGKAYGVALSESVVKDAIATYERSLLTPNSRFDQYLRGDNSALSDQELNGYQLFKSYGCVSCHQGRGVGGNMFEKMGVVRDYFADRGNITTADFGRYNVTGKEDHKFEFKVPSLRNVELTAPYFHDGSAQTLEQAVNVMAYYQLGRKIPDEDMQAIISFLKTLSGELPEHAL